MDYNLKIFSIQRSPKQYLEFSNTFELWRDLSSILVCDYLLQAWRIILYWGITSYNPENTSTYGVDVFFFF